MTHGSQSELGQLVVIAFEHAMFDYQGLFADLPIAASELYGTDPKEFTAGIEAHSEHAQGRAVGYHLLDHVFGSIRPDVDTLVRQLIVLHAKRTGMRDFLFPDVEFAIAQLMKARSVDTAVVSSNFAPTTRFMIELCGKSINRLPMRMALGNLGDQLAANWAEGIVYGGHRYKRAVVIAADPGQLMALKGIPMVYPIQVSRPSHAAFLRNTEGIPTMDALTAFTHRLGQ